VTHWTGSASFRDLDFADDAAVLFLASEIIRIRLDSVMRPRSSSRGGGAIQVTQLQLQLWRTRHVAMGTQGGTKPQ